MVRKEDCGATRPRMVVAYVDSAHAAQCGRFFRRHGWEVHLAAEGSDVPGRVKSVRPNVLVLDVALIDNAALQALQAWLGQQPNARVVLVASKRTPETFRLQERLFAAALFSRDDAIEKLGETLFGLRAAEAI